MDFYLNFLPCKTYLLCSADLILLPVLDSTLNFSIFENICSGASILISTFYPVSSLQCRFDLASCARFYICQTSKHFCSRPWFFISPFYTVSCLQCRFDLASCARFYSEFLNLRKLLLRSIDFYFNFLPCKTYLLCSADMISLPVLDSTLNFSIFEMLSVRSIDFMMFFSSTRHVSSALQTWSLSLC